MLEYFRIADRENIVTISPDARRTVREMEEVIGTPLDQGDWIVEFCRITETGGGFRRQCWPVGRRELFKLTDEYRAEQAMLAQLSASNRTKFD